MSNSPHIHMCNTCSLISAGILDGSATCLYRNQALDFSPASTSLIGEGRQHARALQEAFAPYQDPSASPPAVDERPVLSPISTITETAAKFPLFLEGGKTGAKPEEAVTTRDVDMPAEPKGELRRRSTVSLARPFFAGIVVWECGVVRCSCANVSCT